MRGFTLELTDLDKFSISTSHNLDEAHVNYLMPYPIRYKMVWWQQTGANTFYIWKPIPPTSDFVSLGMVGTKTNDEPPLDAVRCVNKGFLKSSVGQMPSCIWDNKGTGGKKGSFWVMNKLGLLTATEGHDPPEGNFYELKAPKFVAGDAFVLDGQDLSAKERQNQEKARQEALRAKDQEKGKPDPKSNTKDKPDPKQSKEKEPLKPTPAPAKQTSPPPKNAKSDKKTQ